MVKLQVLNCDSSLAYDYAYDFVDGWNDEMYLCKEWQDALMEYLDNSLIYYDDQWKVLQEYCSPQDANWDYAIEELINDVYSHINEYEEEYEEEDEEDEDEEEVVVERFVSIAR